MKIIYETKLNEEIESQFKYVKNLDTTTEDGIKAHKCLTDLLDRSIKLEELKQQEKEQLQKEENNYRIEDLKMKLEIEKAHTDKMIRYLDLGLKTIMWVGGITTYVVVAKNSLIFETSDTPSFSATKDVLKKGLSILKIF